MDFANHRRQLRSRRLRESRSSGQAGQRRKTKSYNLERQVEPLVMACEISGLADLRGYLKSGNLVVRMSFPFVELPSKHPKYIERPANMRPEEPPKQQRRQRARMGCRNRNSRRTK